MFGFERTLKRWRDQRGPRVAVQVERQHLVLGSQYGAHTVCPDGLGPDSVVYSFGVGEDVSFDLALIERFGAQVHAFDPTERSLQWVSTQKLPANFHMNAAALGTYDGTARFFKPKNPKFISHSTHAHDRVSDDSVEVQMRCLRTLMQDRGHTRIDVLKLDIEGSEYDVLDQICEQRLDCRQLLVEFHHQLQLFSYERTRTAVGRLNQHGYRVFYISNSGHEISLIRV
jgi:FkbM family methyltransferase